MKSKVNALFNKFKPRLILGAIAIVILLLSFTIGTFNPNPLTLSKIRNSVEDQIIERAKTLGLHEPDFIYNNKESFIDAVDKCVNYLNFMMHSDERVPSGILIAMAGVESGWGTSRFSTVGNNLFGIRTWDPKIPSMKPQGNPNAKFGVRIFKTKCDSVKYVIKTLNNHHAYGEFRLEREKQSGFWKETWNYDLLVPTLDKWSTNENYADIILGQIKDRNLP